MPYYIHMHFVINFMMAYLRQSPRVNWNTYSKWRMPKYNFKKRRKKEPVALITPHAQRERGKVIGVGVLIYMYMFVDQKKK